MSNHDSNSHGHGGFVEAPHPHVLPLAVYWGIFAALVGLTVLTVAVTWVDLGPFNIVVAMAVAVVKASLVAAIFMHLWFDHKLYTLILIFSLLLLAIFFVLTMLDTEGRALVSPDRANFKPRDEKVQAYQEKNPDGPKVRAYKADWWRPPTAEEAAKLTNPDEGHGEGGDHGAKGEHGATGENKGAAKGKAPAKGAH